MNESELDHLTNLVVQLGYSVQDWDLILIGDGSGTTAEKPCGWSVTVFDVASASIKVLSGGVSHGTNNYGELAPYLHALWLFEHRRIQDSKAPSVLIVSDSEVTVRCGKREYSRRANAGLWASVEWYEKNGYRLEWKHVLRNTNRFSECADANAGRTRKLFISLGERNANAAKSDECVP